MLTVYTPVDPVIGRPSPVYMIILPARQALVPFRAALVYRSPRDVLLPRLGITMTGVRLLRPVVHELTTVVTPFVLTRWSGSFGRLVTSLTIGNAGGTLSSVVGGRQTTVGCVVKPDPAPGTAIASIPLARGTLGKLPCRVCPCYRLMSTVDLRIPIESSEVHGEQLMRPLTARHLLQTELMLSVAEISTNGIRTTVMM